MRRRDERDPKCYYVALIYVSHATTMAINVISIMLSHTLIPEVHVLKAKKHKIS